MKIFIMNWNWLEWTKRQAEYLADCGHEVMIVDNGSSYKPILDWYDVCPFKVIHITGGHNRHVWDHHLHDSFADNYYAVSDADLSLEGIPKDFEQVLIADLER